MREGENDKIGAEWKEREKNKDETKNEEDEEAIGTKERMKRKILPFGSMILSCLPFVERGREYSSFQFNRFQIFIRLGIPAHFDTEFSYFSPKYTLVLCDLFN